MRYHPLTQEDRADMLARIGVDNIDALFADVPAGKLLQEPLPFAPHKSELEVERILSNMAARTGAKSGSSQSASKELIFLASPAGAPRQMR